MNKTEARYFGLTCSIIGHALLAVIALVALRSRAAEAYKAPEVFTVSLEGGETLGGLDSLPDPDDEDKLLKSQLPGSTDTPDAPEPEPEPEPAVEEQEKSKAEEAAEEKAVEEKKAVDEAAALRLEAEKKAKEKEKKLEEEKAKEAEKKKAEAEAKKRAEEAEKKRLEEKRKKEEQEKKAAEEKKRKAEEAKRKAEQEKLEAKRRKEEEKKERARKFEERMKKLRGSAGENRVGADIQTESYNASGQGIGAAKLGSQGRGGGTLTSMAKLAYDRALQAHVKKGWRWVRGSERLQAAVSFSIDEAGNISGLRVSRSSGNTRFDDSVLRATRKASPVPVPPAEIAADYRNIQINFNSQE